jgi:signal peptidase II
MVMENKQIALFVGIAAGTYALDRITKQWALGLTDAVHAGPLRLELVTNTGVAFGKLQGNNNILIIVSVLIIGVLISFLPELFKTTWGTTAAGMVFGGAIGNLTDRLLFGRVIDFINTTIWPVFNIADSAISIGIVLLIIITLFTGKHHTKSLNKKKPKKEHT